MINNIEDYFDYLINNYNLNKTYRNYITFAYLFFFTRESFFWIILLTQQSKLQDKEKMLKVVYTVMSILILAFILENLYLKYKTLLLVSLNEVHLKNMFKMLINSNKSEVLRLNLVEQFMYIESVKQGLDSIVQKKKTNIVILVSSITVLLVSRRINIYLIGGLLLLFNGISLKMQDLDIKKEEQLTQNNTELINKIRNYFIESKQKVLNNTFNRDFCLSLFRNYYNNNLQLVNIENKVNTFNSIIVILITGVVVLSKYKTSSIFDIIVYLLIVYDLDFLVDTIFELYKINKSIPRYNLHLNLLLQNKRIINNPLSKGSEIVPIQTDINSIEIIDLENKLPRLLLGKLFTLKSGDCILVEGKTGQGKTTFFKFLKNIEVPDSLQAKIDGELVYNFGGISDRVYFTIQNNKILYDENLIDYISNHNTKPNLELINKLINIVQMTHIFKGQKDEIIDTNKLSGGELMRISLCQTLYEIVEGDYRVVLFDEIDVNLDNKTAISIFGSICELLKDKILLFIVHNEEIKSYFSKSINVEDNTLKSNF